MAKKENVFRRFEAERRKSADEYQEARKRISEDKAYLRGKNLKDITALVVNDGFIAKNSTAYKILAFLGLNKSSDAKEKNALSQEKEGRKGVLDRAVNAYEWVSKSGVPGMVFDILKPVLIGQGVAMGQRLLMSSLRALNPFRRRRRKR